MNWIIEETQFQNDFNVAQRLYYLLQEKGIPFVTFKYIPFRGTDYSFLPASPAIFYGGINALLDIIERVPDYPRPLAWYNPEVFSCSNYYSKLKPYILQQNHQFIHLEDIITLEGENPAESLFFRPNDNEKTFTGQVVNRRFWRTWASQLMEYKLLAGKHSVICSPAEIIDYEWRLVIVDKKVVAGSQYKDGVTIDIQPGYPVECRLFAEEVADFWSPFPVYILDVCKTNGKYAVMEIGPFNFAGLYKCDLNCVVDAIEGLKLENYSSNRPYLV